MGITRKYEVMVGAVTLIGLTILFMAIVWGKNLSGSVEYYNISMVFKDVNSLKAGDKIFIKGVMIGEIINLKLSADHVLVTGKVDTSVQLYTDATALIVNKELMGGRIVILESGNSGVELKEENFILGKESAGITEMIAKAGGTVEDLGRMIKGADTLITKLNKIMPQKNLGETINEMSLEVKSLNSSLKKSVNQLSSELLVTFKKVDTVLDTLNITLNAGHKGIEEIKPLLARSLPKLDTLLTESSLLLSSLKQKESSLGKLIYEPNSYNKLNQTVERLDSLLLQIKQDGFRVNLNLW